MIRLLLFLAFLVALVAAVQLATVAGAVNLGPGLLLVSVVGLVGLECQSWLKRRSVTIGAGALAFLLLPAVALAEPAAASSPVRAAFDNLLVTVVLPGLGGILIVLFGSATLALKRYLDEKQKGSALARVANRVLHLAEAVVQDLEATLKAEYERAAADGQITKEEAAHLRDVALQRLKSSLGEHGIEELRSVLGIAGGSLEQYLGGVVETAVAKVSGQSAAKMSAQAAAVAPLAAVP